MTENHGNSDKFLVKVSWSEDEKLSFQLSRQCVLSAEWTTIVNEHLNKIVVLIDRTQLCKNEFAHSEPRNKDSKRLTL